MEIIEIPDDITDDEIISLGSKSGDGSSSISSDIEYISNSASQLEREVEEALLLGSPLSVAAASTDDDPWNYEIPRSPPTPKPDLWAHDILGPDIKAAAASRRYSQREPDWREFPEDDGPIAQGNRDAEYTATFDSGHDNVEETASPGLGHAVVDPKLECVESVMAVFPDICRDYVTELYETGGGMITEQLVANILDRLERGLEYPKAKDKLKTLKRKRELNEDEEAVNKYGSIDRENGSHDYSTLTFVIHSVTKSVAHY